MIHNSRYSAPYCRSGSPNLDGEYEIPIMMAAYKNPVESRFMRHKITIHNRFIFSHLLHLCLIQSNIHSFIHPTCFKDIKMQIKTFLPVVLAAVATASPVANPNYKASSPVAQYPTTTQKAQYPTSTPEAHYPTTTEKEVRYSTSSPAAQYPTITEKKEKECSTKTKEHHPEHTKKAKHDKNKHAKEEHHSEESKRDGYPAKSYPESTPATPRYPAASPSSDNNDSGSGNDGGSGGLSGVCPLGDTPLCCQVDVDGIIDLTCGSPGVDLNSLDQFRSTCAETGLTAECCLLPLAGDALLCTTV
ncbi:fungal hydrophobin-domain-containing protein [Daldinia sp. FL1419]|nr:fungal hydrophobin-domain-containing protein [Daldinia sp. FL1419]